MSYLAELFNRFFFSTDKKFLNRLDILLAHLQEMSQLLLSLSGTNSKIERRALTVRVQELEKKVHSLSLNIISGLDHNFLTDISREDIVAIAKTSERIAERIMEACNTIDFLFEDFKGTEPMIALCSSIHESICSICICFKHLQKPVSRHMIKSSTDKISFYNKSGEKLYRNIKADVLRERGDDVWQIKINEWLDQLNEITEQCIEINYIFDQILVKK
ncbi:MAG: hypothetical protein ACK5AY_12410 [Bacteroidota bacterium]|jgi:uncharacterized protein Yka (UPF0111/DUF47 family)